MKRNSTDTKEKTRKLDWQKYDWRMFEKICFEYIKTVYSAKFYKTKLTRAQKDKGRDIIIKGKHEDFEAWGECKNHKRNLDLSTIGKNIVLALSHQINKAIFFSVTNITLNTKTEILHVAQEYGFEVLFLDGTILDETILSCCQVACKYFRKEYEHYIAKNETDIWIDTFLSEYPFAEDAKNNVKIQYHLQNGFRIYLHIFIKNMRSDNISNIRISLKNINETDMIFYETTYRFDKQLPALSDLMHTFCGLVFSPKENIMLPNVEIVCALDNGTQVHEIITAGEVDASDVWKAPYINTASANFFNKATKILQEIIPQNYVRLLYIYGNSGTGKSRLMHEIENKAYENAYRVIHIDFREKPNITSLQDFIMALLGLPSSKNKMTISFSEFKEIFKLRTHEKSLQFIYEFLYHEQINIVYSQLTNAIIDIIAKTSGDMPILFGLDNIQELSRDCQIMFWNILEYCRTISVPICFILSHNTERNSHIKHVLVEYLATIGDEKENYILSYHCDVLPMCDAIILMQQLLHLTPENEQCIEQVLLKNGTLPMDVLLLAKGLSQEDKLFNKIGMYNYIVNPHLLIEQGDLLSVSTEFLIKNRLDNIAIVLGESGNYWQFFSLLCHFDGNLPMEIYEECGFDEKTLYATNNNLITKINYKENMITFYHEKFFAYFSKRHINLSTAILKKVCKCYTTYNNENIISTYHFVKSLIALKENDTAITYGVAALEKYKNEHQNIYVSLLCDDLLEIINPISEPVQYFKTLFLQADIWLENVNISEAEKLFEEAYKIIREKYSLFTPKDITHFFHRYVNQKLHTLQYDKAVKILEEFETLNNLAPNASLIIDDRYCVALYSLGLEKEALERINHVIECADIKDDNTWASIAYSDKAFTYFFNSRKVDKVVSNFKKAISYFEICDEKDSISRKIEIATQSAIVEILENDITQATICIQQAIYIAEKNAHGYLLIPSFNLYVYLLILQKNIKEATNVLKKGLSYANIVSNEKALISIYNNLGNIYIEKNLYSQALEYYKASYKVLKKMCLPSNSLRYRGLICNFIKLSAYLHDEEMLQEVLDNYNFDGLESFIRCYQNSEKLEDMTTNNYGIMGHNGWDYLYY